MKEVKVLTKCINHWAISGWAKFRTINKIYSKLKVKCFEMPNASYTNRYGQLKNDKA